MNAASGSVPRRHLHHEVVDLLHLGVLRRDHFADRRDRGQHPGALGGREVDDLAAALEPRLAGEADAVIYLVGPTLNTTDDDVLNEFNRVTTGQAKRINAIGVLAKIDLNPDVV